MIAMLRRCRRCNLLRSIESFAPLGKLCNDCMKWHTMQPVDRIQPARGYALTDKGRAALKALAAA